MNRGTVDLIINHSEQLMELFLVVYFEFDEQLHAVGRTATTQ